MMRRELTDLSKDFALRIIKLCTFMDAKRGASRTLPNQLLRSGTSIGANIAEAVGAQSEADFLTKYSIAVKEARGTQYWLELITLAEIVPEERMHGLKESCDELVVILTTICKRLKDKKKQHL